MYDSQMQHCAIWRNNTHFLQTAPQCTSFFQLLLNVIYSFDTEFSRSFVVPPGDQGSEPELQVCEVFHHVFSSWDYNTAILSKQSQSHVLLDNPIQQSTIWNMFICIMQHYANYYFYSYWWYIKARSPAVAGTTASSR